jgi:hypothetical protein
MPDDLIPLFVAASRLAFGDDDFVTHRVEVLTEHVIPSSGGAVQVEQEWTFPEIDRETNRMVARKLAGEIEIYARRFDIPSGRLTQTDNDLWQLDDWSISTNPPHEIFKRYDRAGKRFGIGTAEWYDPQVKWSEVERLPSGGPSEQTKPRHGIDSEIRQAVRDYQSTLGGGTPNMDDAVDFVLNRFPGAGRDRVRKIFRAVTGHRDRGRPKKIAGK